MQLTIDMFVPGARFIRPWANNEELLTIYTVQEEKHDNGHYVVTWRDGNKDRKCVENRHKFIENLNKNNTWEE